MSIIRQLFRLVFLDLAARLIAASPNLIFGSLIMLVRRCFDPIIICSVFSLSNVSLLESNHWCTFSKFSFRLSLISRILAPCDDIFVSSANVLTLALWLVGRQFGRSLMYIKKNSGPKFEPYGTPHFMILLLDFFVLLYIFVPSQLNTI